MARGAKPPLTECQRAKMLEEYDMIPSWNGTAARPGVKKTRLLVPELCRKWGVSRNYLDRLLSERRKKVHA